MRRTYIFLILISISFVFGQEVQQERKAFWVVRYALQSAEQIDQIIQTAYSTGITDLFIQARALGEVYFQSNIEHRAGKIAGDFDPLAYTIRKAELYDIKVHAWINMFYIWSGNTPPADSQHVFYRLNHAILRKNSFPAYQELKSNGAEGFFLDPQDRQVQNYLLNLLDEMADNYDVSGIHLDYFRYPDVNYSFTAASRTNFMLTNWYDPLDVYQSSEAYTKKRGFPVFMEADRQYRQYLSDTLTGYLERIKDMLERKPKHIELSVAVKPDPVKAKYRYFQDWMNWLENRLCDFVVVMNYNTDKEEFDRVLNQFPSDASKKNVIMGISTYNQSAEAVLDRIASVRASNFKGFSLFSYNHLIENRAYLIKLTRNRRL
jgi:uncharacterized lipoprotein YddW (UPF0748 family)